MKRFLCSLLLFLLVVVPRASAWAEETPIRKVQVGFDGYFKLGLWAPLRVTLSGPAKGRLRVLVPDNDGYPTQLDLRDSVVDLAQGEERVVSTAFRLGRAVPRLTIEWMEGDRPVGRHHQLLESGKILDTTAELVLQLGADLELRKALQTARGPQARRVTLVRVDDAAEIPDSTLGFNTVDAVVMTTSQTEMLDAISASQLDAMDHWLRSGGRMLWCVGRNGKRLLDPQGRFSRWSPGPFRSVATRWRTADIEAFSLASEPLPGAVAGILSAPLVVVEGDAQRVLCWDGQPGARNLPMMFHYAYGFGQLVFAAVDLDLPPFRDWGSRRSLLAKLLKLIAVEDEVPAIENKQVVHVGFQDISGQLRSALDQFPGVSLISFSWIIGVLMVYILLIGPLDYLVLRRIRKLHWSWVTFPLLVGLFVVLALASAQRWKTNVTKINQVDLVDVDLTSQHVRGVSWAHVYSPTARRYDLTLRMETELASNKKSLLTWQGLPGSGLGGFDAKNAGGSQQRTYTIGAGIDGSRPDSIAVSRLPIRHAATRGLVARWHGSTSISDRGQLTSDPTRGTLQGSLYNPTASRLERCTILYRNWHYEAQSLQPGERLTMQNLRPRRLEWQLTDRTLRDANNRTNSWDLMNHDIPRVMQLFMFHRAAGGRTYTGLGHRYQSNVDLSQLLKTGRAILVGQARKPATRLLADGEPHDDQRQHWVFYRIVFPVKHSL